MSTSEQKSTEQLGDIPTIDLARFLAKSPENEIWKEDCKAIAECLHKYGVLVVKDPRVPHHHNETFIDMMEKYYERTEQEKAKDVRKELHYQVGVTPARTEKARSHCEKFKNLSESDRPESICPPDFDNKLRFFWRMGERPPVTEFQQLNADPVVPEGIPEWTDVMNTWGGLILATVGTVSEMAAIGFDLPVDTFTNLMKFGPHLLAPTGSDFNRFGTLGTILASYHYDLNFLTIHGKSRFPGLSVWSREGKKIAVKVPEGCLLLQAGKQFEWLTGGHVTAGFHEVVVTDRTIEAIEKAKIAGKSLWRVSSTLFSHIASDNTLAPIGHFANDEANEKYRTIKAGVQVANELRAIKLAVGDDAVAAM